MKNISIALRLMPNIKPKSTLDLARIGVLAAFFGLMIFGGLRYDNFLSEYNILTFLG
jgi:hypothetical protein